MKKVEINRWKRYFDFRNNGLSVDSAAKKAHIASATAYRFERGDQASSGLEAASVLGITQVGGNVVAEALSEEAKKALEDFAFFRLRYFGRKSTPWQERAAYEVIRRLETPDREFAVVNMPPGAGKSTLFTHDIICWLIARDRTIRIMVGARTERQARMYVGRIKKSLERDAPLRTSADNLALGIAFDAVAVMQDDFGAFKPEGRADLWRAEALVARQLDGVSLDDKEPTVSAYGADSGFLGGRFDLVVWDDLVDSKNTRNAESKEKLREWWGTEAETRLEPGGLLLLQGQRIGHDDLYRHALDMRTLDEAPKYTHIVYKAHTEEICTGDHTPAEMRAWPEGCLLDPHRLPWTLLETIKRNDPRVFDVQYQQNDGDKVGGLVQEAWIKGGVDDDGYPSPGCLDTHRALGEVPAHLPEQKFWSFVTVDPSPTEWWGIIWWLYDPETQNRYIIDMVRRRMNPEDFLSLDLDTREFSGLMHTWRASAITRRIPLRHIIVEVNAAQKWLLAQPHVQQWMRQTGIVFIGHQTHINKSDPKFGFESIGDLFRQGKIRIPYSGPTTRMVMNDLISEAKNYPDSDTDDLLMSVWFHKMGVENVYRPNLEAGLERMAHSVTNVRRGLAAYT